MKYFSVILLCVMSAAQSSSAEVTPQCCGRYAVMTVASFLDGNPRAAGFASELPDESAPFSLAQLEDAARSLGFETLSIQWADPKSADLGRPCVLHVRSASDSDRADHFVACLGQLGGKVCLCDYPHGAVLVPREDLERAWDGTALYLARPASASISRLRWRLRAAQARPAVLTVAAAGGLALVVYAGRRGLSRKNPVNTDGTA